MSGRNWLERDPSQSPGLQRIKEAQQAAAAAKAQTEQQAREAATAAREAKQLRKERIKSTELAKQRIAHLYPLVTETRNFANQTGTFPLPRDRTHFCRYDEVPPVVEKAEIKFVVDEKYCRVDLELGYGLLGTITESGSINYGDYKQDYSHSYPAVVRAGIRLRAEEKSSEILIQKEHEIRTPGAEGHWEGYGRGRVWVSKTPEIKWGDEWIVLPKNESERKRYLADAFHDPIVLRINKLSPSGNINLSNLTEQNRNKGNSSWDLLNLARGILGLK